MDFEHFAEFIKEKTQLCLGEDVFVERATVIKNNGVKGEALQILQNTVPVSPVIYLESFYKDYDMGRDVSSCVKEICNIFMNNRWEEEKAEKFVDSVTSWKDSCDNVFPVLLPYRGNEEILQNIIYRKYLDLALCYYWCTENENGSIMSIRVSTALLKEWDISEEELHKRAFCNMKKDGYHFMNMVEILKYVQIPCCELDVTENIDFWILTNQKKLYGATGILNTELLETFSRQIKKNLFLLPSSIHEMIVIPDDECTNAEEYKKMIEEVNETMLPREYKLSDHAYYYDRDKKEVRIAG